MNGLMFSRQPPSSAPPPPFLSFVHLLSSVFQDPAFLDSSSDTHPQTISLPLNFSNSSDSLLLNPYPTKQRLMNGLSQVSYPLTVQRSLKIVSSVVSMSAKTQQKDLFPHSYALFQPLPILESKRGTKKWLLFSQSYCLGKESPCPQIKDEINNVITAMEQNGKVKIIL